MENKKRCSKCGGIQPIEDFHPDRSKPDGLHSICKKCRSNAYLEKYKSLKAQKLWRQMTNDVSVSLPTNDPIYWLQANHPGDDILPGRGAYYKLACSTAVFDRAEIITRWPERNHVFVVVRFDSSDIQRSYKVA